MANGQINGSIGFEQQLWQTADKLRNNMDAAKYKHGCLYWLIIGLWLHPLLWLFCTLPMLLITLFFPKKIKLKRNSILLLFVRTVPSGGMYNQ